MSIYDIDSTVREVIGTTRHGVGYNQYKNVGLGQNKGLGLRRAVNANDVITIIQKVLARMPEVQQASGRISIKMTNEPTIKTLSFKYR